MIHINLNGGTPQIYEVCNEGGDRIGGIGIA
jgi:hypothetical protein